MTRAVFLDRDGVINRAGVRDGKPYPPETIDGLEVLAGVQDALSRLREELAIDDVIACYHDGDACDCRKPKPGSLFHAARRHGIELNRSFMIGDRWRDIEAGQRAGCQCLFVDHGYREQQPADPFVRVSSLAAAADWILENL